LHPDVGAAATPDDAEAFIVETRDARNSFREPLPDRSDELLRKAFRLAVALFPPALRRLPLALRPRPPRDPVIEWDAEYTDWGLGYFRNIVAALEGDNEEPEPGEPLTEAGGGDALPTHDGTRTGGGLRDIFRRAFARMPARDRPVKRSSSACPTRTSWRPARSYMGAV
jgi:hypothetical protein